MEVGEAVTWTSLVTGILGAIAFFWQVSRAISARRQSRGKILNKNVLRPWSEMEIQQAYHPGDKYGVRFMIPSEALPSDVAPRTGKEGLDIFDLPGRYVGEVFLRKRYPKVHQIWMQVVATWMDYEQMRGRRKNLIRARFGRDVSRLFPTLRPVAWKDIALDTYVLDNVVAEIEGLGNRDAAGDMQLRINVSRTQSGDLLYYEFTGGSYPLLRAKDTDAVSKSEVEALFTDIVHDQAIATLSAGLLRTLAELKESVELLRSALKEVAIDVDLASSSP